jgi:predicted Co/Zn/Cd cation transporter (cation efflux family)
MKQNIDTSDRILRLILGIGLIIYGLYVKSGFVVLGGVFSLYEALVSWCAFYQLIGRNTCALPSSKDRELEHVGVLFQGVLILAVAIGLNLLISLMSWESWYSFLQQPKGLSIDNALFLFVVYPFVLGLAAKYGKRFVAKMKW